MSADHPPSDSAWMMEQPPGDFGAYLRQARLARALSLRQIAAATKISVHALQSLERNEVSRLPGGIFTRAFVRAYAHEVGLDPDRTLQLFLARFHGEEGLEIETEPVEADLPPRAGGRRATLVRVLGLLVVGAAIVAYFLLGGAPAEPPLEGPVASSPASTSPAAGESGNAARDVMVPGPVERPPAAAQPGTPPPALRLAIVATGDCWISVTLDGTSTHERLLGLDDRVEFEANEEIVLKVGDAGAFAYTLNGEAGRALGVPGTVVTTQITPANYRNYLAPPR